MAIYKNKDIVTNITERGAELGNINVNFYTEDNGTASIRIKIKNQQGAPINFNNTDMLPRLDLDAKDGSIFTKEPVDIILPDQGLIQYKVSDYVIRHEGKMDCKLFLENGTESVHVANFYFVIKDSGVTGAVGKEIKVEVLEDMVRNVMTDNAMGLLDDSYKEKINQDVVGYIASNPDKYKGADGETLKYSELTIQEKEDLKSNITDQAVADFVLGDGSIEINKIAPKSVSEEKTTFIKTGKNIFNKNDVQIGKLLSYTTGTITDNTNYVTSNFIPVSPKTNHTQSHSEIVAFYTLNKTFISGISRSTTPKVNRTFETPSNAYYIRTTTLNTNVDSYDYNGYQIEEGTISSAYEDYFQYINDLKTKVADNAVTNNKILDHTISLDKLEITKSSLNIFNKNTITTGYYVNPTTGNLSVNANYSASDFIKITGSDKLTKTNTNNLYSFYTKDKHFLSNTNTSSATIVVPSSAEYVRISVLNSSINTDMLVIGDAIPSEYIPYKLYIPNEYIEESKIGTEVINGVYGKDNLKTYISDISKQLNPDITTRAEVAFIGDSWVEGGAVKKGERLTLPLREKMKSIYGDGGIGFVGLANSHIGNGAVSVTLTGTWTHYDEGLGNISQSKGLDSAMVESNTVGDTIKVQFYEDVDSYEIHTLNTGSYRYNIDGGEWVTVDATTKEVSEIPLSLGKHIINIEIVSGKVTFVGSYAYKGNKGVVIHKIGNGGLKASHIASTDRTNWIKQLKRCKANTFGILLGTNDMAQSVPIANYETDMKEVVSRIKEAKPNASIILIAPSGNKYDNTKLHTIRDYSDIQYKIAQELGISHVSLFRALGDYTTTNANGLMFTDGVHPNQNGGYAISNIVYDRLLRI